MRSLVVLLLIVAAAFVAAVRLLPGWALVALLSGLVLSVVALVKWGLPWLLKAPFRAKGAVLRGARVRVHSVEPADPPESAPDDAHAAELVDHYRIELTITPGPATGAFSLWEPGELRLVTPAARADHPETDETAGDIRVLEIEQDGDFVPDSGMKYGGPQRLRLLVAAAPATRRLRVRYYFELLGDVALPTTTARSSSGPLVGAS